MWAVRNMSQTAIPTFYFIVHIAAACLLAVQHLLPKCSWGVAPSVQRYPAAAAPAAAARQRLRLSGDHGGRNQCRMLHTAHALFCRIHS